MAGNMHTDAAERGAALQQLGKACSALREELAQLYEQRVAQRGKPLEPEDKARLKARRWQVLLRLGAMKAGLRDTFLEADERKTRVQAKKDVAEAHQLQLQNLLYEKDHLLREIRRCRGFSTKEMDKIEFETGDLPIVADPSVHDKHLVQLTKELAARKQLQEQLKTLKEKIAKVDAAIETKQSFLDALPEQLEGIEASTKGLQSYMGEPVSALRSQQLQASTALPTPLYALYCELEAYQTASSDAGKQLTLAVVDAVGVKAAHGFRKRGFPSELERASSAPKKLKTPSRSPSASAAGTAPPPPPSRAPSRSPSMKRLSGAGAALEPEKGDVTASHTAEKLLELRPHQETSESEEDTETKNLWQTHAKALQLSLTVASPSDAHSSSSEPATFTLLFQYLPTVKLVTAEVVKTAPASINHGNGFQNILMNLFPGDDGLAIPRLSVNYAYSTPDGEVSFPEDVVCRPYYWTQWICGLTPLKRVDASQGGESDAPPPRRPEPSVRNVMTQLVARLASFVQLKKQLEQLAKVSTAPVQDDGALLVHTLARHVFPREIATRLEDWKEIPAPSQDVFQLFRAHATPSARPRPQFHLSTTGCRYFRVGLKNGRAKVSAIVEIAPEYPVRAPRFLFQPRSGTSGKALEKEQVPVYENQLKELETEVNAYYDELTPAGSEQWLLLHQLRKVEQCFDVLCRAEGDAEAQLCFGRERRGKDRRPALVMDAEAKELRHR